MPLQRPVLTFSRASSISNEPLVFLGYRAKRPWHPDPDDVRDPTSTTGVVEVCSVSDCISEPPPDWEKRWDFNQACCYADPAEAIATIPPGERSTYAVFAYWLLPGTADPSQMFDSSLPPLPASNGPTDFEILGFDVVEMNASLASGPSRLPAFGHSPLSCNYMAREIRVNRYCLVDGEDEAKRLVERFNEEQPEPGTYFAIRVAREVS